MGGTRRAPHLNARLFLRELRNEILGRDRVEVKSYVGGLVKFFQRKAA